MLSIIPDELIEEIFSHSEKYSLLDLSLVNRKLAKLAIPCLWKDPFNLDPRNKTLKANIISILLQELPTEVWKRLKLDKFLPNNIVSKKTLFNNGAYLQSLDISRVIDALFILLKKRISEEKSQEGKNAIAEKIFVVAQEIFQSILGNNNRITELLGKFNAIEAEIPHSLWRETFSCPLRLLSQNPNLKQLCITPNPRSDSIKPIIISEEIVINTPKLQRLKVIASAMHESQLIRIFISSGKNLKSLNINIRLFNSEIINTIAENCQNLYEIQINDHQLNNFCLAQLVPIFQACQELQSFAFYFSFGKVLENPQPPGTLLKIFPHFTDSLLDLTLCLPFHENDVIEFFNNCRLDLKVFIIYFSGNPRTVYEALNKYHRRCKENLTIKVIKLVKTGPEGRHQDLDLNNDDDRYILKHLGYENCYFCLHVRRYAIETKTMKH